MKWCTTRIWPEYLTRFNPNHLFGLLSGVAFPEEQNFVSNQGQRMSIVSKTDWSGWVSAITCNEYKNAFFNWAQNLAIGGEYVGQWVGIIMNACLWNYLTIKCNPWCLIFNTIWYNKVKFFVCSKIRISLIKCKKFEITLA